MRLRAGRVGALAENVMKQAVMGKKELPSNNVEAGFLFQYPVKSRQTRVPGWEAMPKDGILGQGSAVA
jgi:hypothetical protein